MKKKHKNAWLRLVLLFTFWASTSIRGVPGGVRTALGEPLQGSISAQDLLRRRPLEPGDRSLFSPGIYPDAPPMVDAPAVEPTERQAYSLLNAYFATEARFSPNPAKYLAGLKAFSDPDLVAKMPSPSLRAALLATVNTIAEPAINFQETISRQGNFPRFRLPRPTSRRDQRAA